MKSTPPKNDWFYVVVVFFGVIILREALALGR